jgi:hypothetical protein
MNTYEYQKLRGLKRKLFLIDLRGSCCEKCGYNKNLASLDFHHEEPGQKESQLDMRTLANSSMKWILEEFEKCKVLCANCHREEHHSELEISIVRNNVKKIEDSILEAKDAGKPKCCDCGAEINYTYKRCRPCGDKAKRKVERPNLILLQKEKELNGVEWCSKKYKVSPKTIRKWLQKQIQ